MKITKAQLKQIIKEELSNALREESTKPYETPADRKYAEDESEPDYIRYPDNPVKPQILWQDLNLLLQGWQPKSEEGIKYKQDLTETMKLYAEEKFSKVLDQGYKPDPELRAQSREARRKDLRTAIKDSPKPRKYFAAYKELFDKPDLSFADYKELVRNIQMENR